MQWPSRARDASAKPPVPRRDFPPFLRAPLMAFSSMAWVYLGINDWRRVPEVYVATIILLPRQVACTLLVTWKLWFWPHWSALPYPDFVVPDDDPHSFDQYNTTFAAQMHDVAVIASNVPRLYSLVLRLLFVWWQNAAHLRPGYTCVYMWVSRATCRAHRQQSHHLWRPTCMQPSGM